MSARTDGRKSGGGTVPPYSPSLRRRLITQLLGLSAILAIALFFAVRISSEQASEATLDGILGAATTAIAEELRRSMADRWWNCPPAPSPSCRPWAKNGFSTAS
ncbi:hypothetical protein V6L77_21920 [Pannonibacter sp. Pt2-lr]